MNLRRAVFALSTCVLVMTILLWGCNEPKIKSSWRDHDITVDGKSVEWQDCDPYYDENSRTLVGMVNDDKHLYVFLSSHDRKLKRQIMGLGLTVWFDPKGEEEKAFGIRFPVGMARQSRMPMKGGLSGEDSDPFQKMLEDPQTELQIFGPEEYEQKTMLLADIGKYGIDVNVNEVEGNLVYELKVPLTQNGNVRHAIRTDMAKRIGVGFETGKLDMEKIKKRFGQMGGGGGGRDGGRGKMGRKPSGGMGGGPPGGMRERHGGQMPEPFELWTKVQLASKS